jgi:hypothetical protein
MNDQKTSYRRIPLASILLAALLLLLASCNSSVEEKTTTPDISGEILLPNTITTAGQPVDIFTTTDSDLPQSGWMVIWSDAFGDLMLEADTIKNGIALPVPDSAFQHSGMVVLSLCYDGLMLDQKSLKIIPGPAYGVIESYAGAKTMVVGSRQTAMEVVIPKDRFGNPVTDGNPAQFNFSYPGSLSKVEDRAISNMVASITLAAGENSGHILIGASSGEAMAIEETIELTPAWPVSFDIQITSCIPYADPRQNIVLTSNVIKDQKNNKVADGTVVYFTVSAQNRMVAQYRSFTSNGIAEVYIQNPDHATTWTINAAIAGGIQSNAIIQEFKTYVQQISVNYEQKQRTFVIGPVTGHLGQMVTDDLPVELLLQNEKTSMELSGKTENGFCRLKLPVDFPKGQFNYQVRTGGREVSKKIRLN